jgi:hypothetical protein
MRASSDRRATRSVATWISVLLAGPFGSSGQLSADEGMRVMAASGAEVATIVGRAARQ